MATTPTHLCFVDFLLGGPPRGDGPVPGCLPAARLKGDLITVRQLVHRQEMTASRILELLKAKGVGVVATPHGVLPRDSH